MYCVNSIALLLMIVCYTDALNDGNNPTPLAPTLTRPDPTIQQVCCSKRWHICCRAYPWSITKSRDQIMKAICKKYLKKFPEHGIFGPECVNEYQVFSDMKVARNRIYEYHSCCSDDMKDYQFINKTIWTINEIDPIKASCCKKHFDIDAFNINVGRQIVELDRLVNWPADEVYNRYIKNEESPPCEKYGDARMIPFKLQTTLRRLAIYRKCAKYIACSTNN